MPKLFLISFQLRDGARDRTFTSEHWHTSAREALDIFRAAARRFHRPIVVIGIADADADGYLNLQVTQ